MKKLDFNTLKTHLFKAADILRGRIDSGEYKQYIFGLLFLKRLNDVFIEEVDKQIKKGIKEELARNDRDFHSFFVPERARWEELRKVSRDVGAGLNKAFEVLEDENPILQGVLTAINFNDKERLPDDVLQRLIIHFSEYNLGNINLEDADILGRAYEYLIEMFADDAGKKGGEFYTPKQIVKLIVELVDPKKGMRVYDPACGSGGMLIYSALHVQEKNGGPLNLSLYSQERNLNTWAICKMNLLLHDLPDAHVEKGDTLRNPKFLDEGEIQQFDRVIANPMWNQKDWNKDYLESDPYGRMIYGLPSASSGDWAWVQHMLASLNKDGKMGVVLDNGVLFRGGIEGEIREKIIKEDLISAVIALPLNLFYNTGSPGCILILERNKPQERKVKIIFIYGEEDFEDRKRQNYLRDKDIEKILNAFKNFKDIEKYCHVAGFEEIKENDFNLSVPRYVDTIPDEEPVDIKGVLNELKKIEKEREKTKQKVEGYLKELGF